MTPKEKAKELVKKYLYLYNTNIYESKQCALIAVDEIWNELESERVFEKYDYWKEVKQEIENL